jgi:hypothetical protein
MPIRCFSRQKLAGIGLHVGRAAPASQVSIQPVFLARAPARNAASIIYTAATQLSGGTKDG